MGCSSTANEWDDGVVHFVLFPLMAQGHMIPMLDIAKLLAQREGVRVTIFTTPQNAARFQNSFKPQTLIQFKTLQFSKLPSDLGFENLDQLPSLNLTLPFFSTLALLQPQALALCEALSPKPSAIVSDLCLPWTLSIARRIRVPWVSFYGGSCFCNVVMSRIWAAGICSRVGSDEEYFEVPELAHRIEVTKAQLPTGALSGGMLEFVKEIGEADAAAYGTVMNSFEELEGCYVSDLKKVRGNERVWCVGPVSLCNQLYVDKAHRGKASTEEKNDRYMKWLDSQDSNSVVYVCLGSLHNLTTPQLIELGLGLESSNRPFIWVVRASSKLENWIQEEGFEERIKTRSGGERGLIIRDWAPQVLILSHPAIGAFLTHCGWNSVLEGISAGLPMVTWPLFSEQFLNEKVVVDVLKIGVKVGAEYPVTKMKEEKDDDDDDDEEKKGIIQVIKKDDVREAIERVMGEGVEAEERRKKATELAEMAKNALEEGGSSQLNITLLIDDVLKVNNISS